MPHSLDHSVILPAHLHLGAVPRLEDLAALQELGVTAVLSLLHPSDPLQVPPALRDAFTFHQIPIVDSYRGGVPTPAQLAEAVATMRAWRRAGHVIYLHCLAGQGRSPLVAMAYLAMGNDEEKDPQQHRLTAAIAQVRALRPLSDPNVHQLAVLCETLRQTLNPTPMTTGDRFQGALLGLALGDALGTTLEFQPPGTFEPLTDMVGGGPFHLPPGSWTDDTSMALCLAESLAVCGEFNARDQIERYVRWFRHGHMSVTGACFDIGGTVREALCWFERTGEPFSGSTDRSKAGNGSLMRLAPVAMAFMHDPELAIRLCAESSRTTHGARTAVDACRYFGGLLIGALQGVPKATLLAPEYSPVPGVFAREPLCGEILAIARGSFKTKRQEQIQGSGYVVDSLEAALWAFHQATDFESAALLAANLGDDSDTTAAIAGQLAGAHYGLAGLPERWLALLARRGMIRGLAEDLHHLAVRPHPMAAQGQDLRPF